MAIDSKEAALYVRGVYSDERSFADPCPPSIVRFAATAIGYTQTNTSMPAANYGTDPEFNAQFVVNAYLVKQEDAKLLTSLAYASSEQQR